MDQKNKRLLIAAVRILYVLIIIFLLYCLFNLPLCASPLAAINAKNRSYLEQMRSMAAAYFDQNNTYVGLAENSGNIALVERIAKNMNNPSDGCAPGSCAFPWLDRSPNHFENLFSQQIKERSFCAKVNFTNKTDGRYWCVDSYGYNGTTTGQYCTSEKPYCEDLPSLPQGYTFDNYSIEKNMEVACQKISDCITPIEYSAQSRCPFTSLCLEGKCAVICPAYDN